jgi:hypothetical protein
MKTVRAMSDHLVVMGWTVPTAVAVRYPAKRNLVGQATGPIVVVEVRHDI